jgi:hypothetical protein
MIVKMLTHVHKVVISCWCWHICEGDRVRAVERGLGSFLPPTELARRDSGVFEEMKWLFSFTPKVGRSGEVTKVVVTILQVIGASHGGDRRWPCVCRFTPGTVSRGGGDGRVDAHATDAIVSVCRSVFGGLASARASDTAPYLSIDRQTRLSWLSGARERSGALLSRDRRWSGWKSYVWCW